MTNIQTQQSGRSMIEMLGVLAIIGVLSVGGIAGYSQAMSKFKVTKTSDQIQTMVTNIRTLFAAQRNYASVKTGTASTSELLYSVGILTDEMCPGGGNACSTPVNPYAGDIELSGTSVNNKHFYVKYSGLTADACVRLATQDWGDSSSGLISVKVEGGTTAQTMNSDVAGALPMTLSTASTGCGTSGSESILTLTYK